MSGEITEKEAIKDNALRLVAHHRENCDGPECNISLFLVRRLFELAGIELDDQEKGLFI